MKDIRTARGRVLNMGQLATEHEKTRAVSNVPINAKGDIIDNRGEVKVPREKISKEYYRDNLTGIEEQISIKEEPKTPAPPPVEADPAKAVQPEPVKPKAKPAPAPKPKAEPVVTEEEGVTEVGRRTRTREDGTKYVEVEFSDGSMTTEEEIND